MTGFKNFLLRGNLVEIAVAFIMAAAFAKVVTATVAVIMDLVGKAGGTPDFSSYKPGGVHVGAWLTAVIAFIMAASFAAVVTSFTNVIMSLISKVIGGNPDFSSITWGGVPVGAFFTALISFLILAAVVYFGVVMPYTKAKERFFPSKEPEGTPEDVALLTEIRDLLARR